MSDVLGADRSKTFGGVYHGDFHPPRAKTKGKEKDGSMLRKRTTSSSMSESPSVLGAMKHPAQWSVPPAGPSGTAGAGGAIKLRPGVKALDQLRQTLGEADFSGWMMKKGERYNTWKVRFFYLKGPHMYYLRSNTVGPLPVCYGLEKVDASPCKQETRVKGYININGYKVVADDTINPGRYGFRIFHEVNKSHAFASDEHAVVRDWMKALMKATIDRDYTRMLTHMLRTNTNPVLIILGCRTGHFVCQCPHHSTYHCASYEPCSSATFADSAGRGTTGHACRRTGRVVPPRRPCPDGRAWGWCSLPSATKSRLTSRCRNIPCARSTVARYEKRRQCCVEQFRHSHIEFSCWIWTLDMQ